MAGRLRTACTRLLPLLLVLALPAAAQVQFNYVTTNGTITITKYTGAGGAVTIPSTINKLPVTTVGRYAFYDCTNLTRVTIPDSVTSIGDGAFGGCTSLTSVTIPTSVTSIGDSTFYSCTSLTSVTIPDSVTSIGDVVFASCTSLTSVTIGNGVTSIGHHAFASCTSLTSFTIPNSVTSIGDMAFGECTSLTNVTIPDSVTSIGNSAFSRCTSLTSVTIPNSVSSIGDDAFSHCTSLTRVTIGNGVASIGRWAFWSCSSLIGVYFQGNAPSVGSSVFSDANNATIYYLPGTTGWGPTFGGRPTAPLVDTARPSVMIRSPRSGTRLTNGTMTISGTASDDVYVAAVEWRLENSHGLGPYRPASGTTKWSASVVGLEAGTNTVRVRAWDVSGKLSSEVTRSFVYVLSSPLTITINGSGVVTPNLNGQALELGKMYTLTATPGTGHLFSNWIAGVIASTPTLTFSMRSNLVLEANFVPNPFIAVKGSYHGLFYQDEGVLHESSGSITVSTTGKGIFAAKLRLAGRRHAFTGQFDLDGRAAKILPRAAPSPPLSVELSVALVSGVDQITGRITDGIWSAPLRLDRAVFNSRTNPASFAGKYTMVIPGDVDAAASPGGHGYGRVIVSSSGVIRLSGVLGDGTKVSQGVPISKEGWWPLYAALYHSQGSMLGWLKFDSSQPQSDVAGDVSWIKPSMATARYYPAGFTNMEEVIGSLYTPPVLQTDPVIAFTNGLVEFSAGNLSSSFTNQVVVTDLSKVINLSSNKLVLTTAKPSGLFSGTVVLPKTGKSKPFKGAILQKLDVGYGYFLGTNQGGRVEFKAVP
jgi:hypothetical protein